MVGLPVGFLLLPSSSRGFYGVVSPATCVERLVLRCTRQHDGATTCTRPFDLWFCPH